MSTEAGPPSYTLQSIQQMLGMSRSVVVGFVKAGFVSPTRGPRNTYRFGFQDVVLLRTAQSLRDADIPTRRIRQSLRRLRSLLPAELPLTGLRITAVGDDVAVQDGDRKLVAESGQLLLEFEVAPSGGGVALLPAPPAADTDADAWLGRGEALESTSVDDAAAAYREAIRASPARSDAYLNLGALLHDAGDEAGALAVYDEALVALPDDADLHFNRAIVLEDLRRHDDALASYERCLKLDPEFSDAHWNAARLYEQLGRAQQALQHFSAFRRLQR